MLCLELLFPVKETLYGYWCECWKFGSLKYLDYFLLNLNLSLVCFSLDKVLKNPKSDLFHDIEYNGFVSVFIKQIFNLFSDFIHIISGNTGNGFDLISKWSFRISFSEFEMERDLIFELMIRRVGSTENSKFIRIMLFDDMKFIQINVWQYFELILLKTLALDLSFSGVKLSLIWHGDLNMIIVWSDNLFCLNQ